jgi:hypothetical protein
MHAYQKSIGRERARALFAAGWWQGRTARQIARFQLFTVELCLPFAIFHRALEEALGRAIWIHEFGFGAEALAQELLGERDPPTLKETLSLLPPDVRQEVFLVDEAE